MPSARGFASSWLAITLCGCTLIDLDRLSDATGGSTATSSTTATATSDTSTSTSATTTTTTVVASVTTDTSAVSSGGGCAGPTYCETSNAQFCDDFDTEASRGRWSENVSVEPGTRYELAFVREPARSCPMSAKTALLAPQPDDTYVQWHRGYTAPEPYDAVSLAFTARKEQVATGGRGTLSSLIYRVSNGDYCEVLLRDTGSGVGVSVQRIFDGGAILLREVDFDLPMSTLGTWIDHELYVDSGLGDVEIDYTVRLENGMTFVVPIDDVEDEPCGEGELVSNVDLKLGTNYLGEAPSVTYFDDVELEIDP